MRSEFIRIILDHRSRAPFDKWVRERAEPKPAESVEITAEPAPEPPAKPTKPKAAK